MNRLIVVGIILAFLIAVFGAFLLWYPREGTTAKENLPPPARDVPQGFKEYKNGRFGFSLFYSDFLEIEERQETATSWTIVFEDKETEAGFQIFVVHYPDDEISEERFLMDVPSGIRLEEEAIEVDGVPAVQFLSHDGQLGETREVWFIKNGYLFEVTTYKPLDRWFKLNLDTWKWLR